MSRAGILVVAALHEEVTHVPTGIDVIVTGVGKANAAAVLARRLAEGPRPQVVVNVGTAGAVDPEHHGIAEIGYVTQHDLPYPAIERLLARPLPRGFLLQRDIPPVAVDSPPEQGVNLATGDVFVADAAVAAAIRATGLHLVDMEGYGYATTCAEFGVPLRCVKAVSDGADELAGETWLDTIEHCARALGDWLATHL